MCLGCSEAGESGIGEVVTGVVVAGTKCPIPMTLEDEDIPADAGKSPFVGLDLPPGYLEELRVTGDNIKDVTAYLVEDLPEEKVRTASGYVVVVRIVYQGV